MATILASAAAAIVALWGIAHAIPTGQVLVGFRPITQNNRRVVLQEWLAEAFTMWGLAAVIATMTLVDGAEAHASQWIYRVVAGLLIALAVLTTLSTDRLPRLLRTRSDDVRRGRFVPGAGLCGLLLRGRAGRTLATCTREIRRSHSPRGRRKPISKA